MKDISCEEILMAEMAKADGERAELSPEEIDRHLSVCEACRAEIAQLAEIDHLLQCRTRAEQTVDLWPEVKHALGRPATRIEWQPFAVAGVTLVGYKLVEMLVESDPGLAIRLVPLIVFALLILFLRENPFRINTDLVLEK